MEYHSPNQALFFDLVVHTVFYAGIYFRFMVAAIQIAAALLSMAVVSHIVRKKSKDFLRNWLNINYCNTITESQRLKDLYQCYANTWQPLFYTDGCQCSLAAAWLYSGLPCKWHCVWLPWWLATNRVNILSKNWVITFTACTKIGSTFHCQKSESRFCNLSKNWVNFVVKNQVDILQAMQKIKLI